MTLRGFTPVVIDRAGGHYQLMQGRDVLLRIPGGLFAQYKADSVFPPLWRPREESHPVRRLFWNPDSREFLMAGLDAHPARLGEEFGSTPFRSFLQGFWIPTPPVLLLRPYWNPADPYDDFDRRARQTSFDAQWSFWNLLGRLMPPHGWNAILNATDPYLEALGVTLEGPPAEPEAIRELSLTPPGPVGDASIRKALEALAVENAGNCFPMIREGALCGVHTLCLPALHSAEALLRSLDITCQEGPFRPH
jgi:hypothetical protein